MSMPESTAPAQTPAVQDNSVSTSDASAAPAVGAEQGTSVDKATQNEDTTAPVFDPITSEIDDPIFQHPENYKRVMSREEIAALPQRVQMLLHNMRRDYTQKSQTREESYQSKFSELEAKAAALKSQEGSWSQEREATLSAILQSENQAQLQQKAEVNDDDLPGLYEEGGIDARIEREVAKRLVAMQAPIQTELQQQMDKVKAQASAEKFNVLRATLPEFDGLVPRMVELRETTGVTTELAHQIAYSELIVARQQEQEQQHATSANERNASERMVGRPSSVSSVQRGNNPEHLKGKGAWERYLHFKETGGSHTR